MLLELGGEQAELLADDLVRLGYGDVITLFDDEGDVRGIEATTCEGRGLAPGGSNHGDRVKRRHGSI